MDRELKRGTLGMLTLKLLSERERYGYELSAVLEERTGGRFSVKGGTLYPVLYRLEEAGYVETRWQTPDRGAPRKYYAITARGTEELERRVGEWREFSHAVERVLEGEEPPEADPAGEGTQPEGEDR